MKFTRRGGVISGLQPRSRLPELGEELSDSSDELAKGVHDGFAFLECEVDLNGGTASGDTIEVAFEKYLDCFVLHGGHAEGALIDYKGATEVNLGQKMTKRGALCMAAFGVDNGMKEMPGPYKMEMDSNSCLLFLVNGILCGPLYDGATPKDKVKEHGAKFVRDNVTFLDWSSFTCRGTKEVPAGNKWPLMREQLEARSAAMGLEGDDRMDIWSLASLVLLGFHVAYHIVHDPEQKPVDVLYASTRNVELNHDNPEYKPIRGPHANIYNVTHPEATVMYLGNPIVHPPWKLERYTLHLTGFCGSVFAGKHLGDEDRTEVDTADAIKCTLYYRFAYGKDGEGLTEEDIEARYQAGLANCKKGGDESTKLLRLAMVWKSGMELSVAMKAEWQRFLDKAKYKGDEKALKESMENRLEGCKTGGYRGGYSCMAQEKGVWSVNVSPEQRQEWTKKGGDTKAANKLANEQILGVLMDNGEYSVPYILDMVAQGSMNMGSAIDAFSSAREEILRLKEEADPLIVWPAGDDNVVIVPSKGNDVTTATYQFIVGLKPLAETSPNDWRIKASMKEGIDWRQYDSASWKKAGEGKVLPAGDSAKTSAAAQLRDIAKKANKKPTTFKLN